MRIKWVQGIDMVGSGFKSQAEESHKCAAVTLHIGPEQERPYP